MNLHFLAIIALLVGIAFCDNNTALININQHYKTTLRAEQTYSFQVNIPSSLLTEDFYLVVQWPSSDPLQNPFIDISTTDGYLITCYNSHDQFSGVCNLPNGKLTPNSSITAAIYCFVDCQLDIYPSLAPRLTLALTDSTLFTAPPSSSLPLEIDIQIPISLNFTQIALYAQIESFEKATEGLEMYANIGNASISAPTNVKHDRKGQSVVWGGKGIFLSKEEVKGGEWVRLYLLLSRGLQVRLFSSVLAGNNYMIEFGKSYFDFTSPSEDKTYILDLRTQAAAIKGKTISIGFVAYSGSPYVKISMDFGFVHTLKERGFTSTSNFLITPRLRDEFNFSGVIYIKVNSYSSADYLLYSQALAANYMSIFADTALYTQLEPNDVYNYFFDDLVYFSNSTLRNYSITIDMISGKATFGIRRCKSAERGLSLLDCVISDVSKMGNQTVLDSFEEIDLMLKRSEAYYYLTFQLDITQCSLLANISAHYCAFHIAAIENGNSSADYTITLNKRVYTSLLQEGSLARTLVFKDEYLYFKFVTNSLQDILSVTFYATTIEGDIYLIASNALEFPTIASPNISFSASNQLTFTKDHLAPQLYLTVYGLEVSQFTLGVKVTRAAKNSTGNSSQTKLRLTIDLSQEFVLEEAETEVTFQLATRQTLNVTVEVMQLAGTVSLQVLDQKNSAVRCIKASETNSKITCTFESLQNSIYSALITAKKGEVQKFVILYHKQEDCLTYSLNTPLYLTLDQGEKICVTYSQSKLKGINVVTNVPVSNLLSQSLSMLVCLNDNCLQPTQSHHQQITQNQLASFCKLNNSRANEACSIQIFFASNSSVGFEVVVEEEGRDMGLFDGIVERVSSYGLSHEEGKYLYYYIYDWSPIKIFLTSHTTNSYYLALHFVNLSDFLSNSSAVYLPYRDSPSGLDKQFSSNFYETVAYGSETNVFTISKAIVEKYCSECLLAISIYPWVVEKHGLSSFEIEVSQTETTLFLGQSKIGYLEEGEIYNYQLEASAESDALLALKDLNRESNKQGDCFAATFIPDGQQTLPIRDGTAYIAKGTALGNLYVEAVSNYCNYEVTYMRLDFPLVLASLNRKYPFERSTAGRMFFLYTHTSTQSFKIVQIAITGALNVYATPLANRTISALLRAPSSDFPFVSSEDDGEFTVSNSSRHFCTGCQYLVVVESFAAARSEILFANDNSSIPLSVNGLIKERMAALGLSHRNYTFNAISAFNISLSLLYGKLNVVIIDPLGNVVANSTITATQLFRIPQARQTEDLSYDYDSPYTRYYINVRALADCSFTIKASKESITSRLFEGIPFYYDFDQKQTVTLEFLNLNEASPITNSLNILVDLLDLNSTRAPTLKVTATLENVNGSSSALAISSMTESDSVWNIELPLRKGTYYVRMESDISMYASIILVKQSLVHLKASSTAILFKEATFELYSSNKAVMVEVFTCWGEASVAASSKYSDLSSAAKSNELVLEHNNYGGHSVIRADQVFGEYFIKVGSLRKEAELGYMITYYYYDLEDVAPYKLVELGQREVTYKLGKTSITFVVEPIIINWELTDAIDSILVEYHFYIADSKIKVGQYANCRLGKVLGVTALTQNVRKDTVEVEVEMGKIGEAIGEQPIYFVGAEARAFIETSDEADEDYPEELRLIYEVIEMSNVKVPAPVQATSSYSAQMIVIWFLLPFALAGLILYFAIKFFIRKYRGLLPNELIEEGGESEQGVNLPNHSPYNPNDKSQSLKDEV